MYTPTTLLFDHKVFLSRCSSKTSARIRPTAPRHCTTDLLLPSPCDVMRARATQQLVQYAEEVRSADWNSNSWGSRPEKLSHRCCYVTADATWTAPAHLMQPTMGQLTLSSLMNVTHHLFALTDHCWHLNPTTAKINKLCWEIWTLYNSSFEVLYDRTDLVLIMYTFN